LTSRPKNYKKSQGRHLYKTDRSTSDVS